MRAIRVVNALSGLLLVLAGLALMLNIRYPVKLEPSTLVGIALIVIGVSVAFNVPFLNALILGISIATLLLSLGGFNVSSWKGEIINGTFEEGESFAIRVNAGELHLTVSNCKSSSYSGAVIAYSITKSALEFTGELHLTLCKAREVRIEVNAGRAEVEVKRCLRVLKIWNDAGSVDVSYEVLKGCGGRISVENNVGSVRLRVKVPEEVKVVYSTSSTLGRAEVLTPEGAFTGSGSFGEGETALYLNLRANLGSVIAEIEK